MSIGIRVTAGVAQCVEFLKQHQVLLPEILKPSVQVVHDGKKYQELDRINSMKRSLG
jgi:hypothetical protein